jgi:hypothetical protein
MLKSLKIRILILILTVPVLNLEGQSFAMVRDSSAIRIAGTSNLHEWKMDLRNFDCTASFDLDGHGLAGITSATFKGNSNDLRSDNSMMDRKAHEALKSKTDPAISFTLSWPVKISAEGQDFKTDVTGDLVIAGKSNKFTIPVSGSLRNINGKERIDVIGSTRVSMKSFSISPPTFMMGALKTGDVVTVSFSIQFEEK